MDDKCLQYLFSFLDTESLTRAAQTCSKWHDLVQVPALWSSVELLVAKALVVDKSLQILGPKLEMAREVSLLSCRRITADGLAAAGPYLKNCESLNLGGVWNTTDAALEDVLSHTPRLQTLLVGGCHLLTDASLAVITRKCPDIEHVSFRFLWDLSADGIINFIQSTPSLNHIDLTHIPAVDEALINVAANIRPDLTVVIDS